MPNPTKPTTNLAREELRQAIRKDFHELLVKEFTADWKIQRLLHDLELNVMDFGNTMQLFDTYTQAKEREARIASVQLYMDTCENNSADPSWESIHEFQDGQIKALADLEAEKETL